MLSRRGATLENDFHNWLVPVWILPTTANIMLTTRTLNNSTQARGTALVCFNEQPARMWIPNTMQPHGICLHPKMKGLFAGHQNPER